jgi:hypothetical protein
VGAEFMAGRPDRIVARPEVDAPESGSRFFTRALEYGVAVAIADGDPKPGEDGGAFRVAEGANAEQIVLEGWHDVAKPGASRWKRGEVEGSSGGGVLALAGCSADGDGRARAVDVDDGGSGHEIVAAGAGVGNGGVVQG